MTSARARFTPWMCTFFALLLPIFQSLLLHTKTLAFSPSLPVSVGSSKCRGRQYKEWSCQRATASNGSKVNVRNSTEKKEEIATTSLPIRYNPSLLRFRCRISYDGTSFSGFQLQGGRVGSGGKQTNLSSRTENSNKKKTKKGKGKSKSKNNPRTIQGELERVLSTRFQRVVKVIGAGRTDGGVHARGQAIHFDLYQNETLGKPTNRSSADGFSFERDLEYTMNRMLPVDIRAWNLERASPEEVAETGSNFTLPGVYNWNAMRSSTSKLYSYRICVGDAMDPSERFHRWQLPWRGLDAAQLQRILKKFEGQHDFVCFAGALEQQQKKTGIALGTIRTIHEIRLVKEVDIDRNRFDINLSDMGGDPSEHYYRIDIYLDGALYKMVRNIVGTAIDVCRESVSEEVLSDLLDRPKELKYSRKNNPCVPAPPNGLTLERVFYSDHEHF